jgi:membrane-associated phospholipid phosphatase
MNLRGLVTNPAFPSGDSAQAAVVATALFLQVRAARRVCAAPLHSAPNALLTQTSSWLWLVAMLPTMVARVYFGCHWVGDTLGGAAVGAALTSAVHAVVDPLLA